MQLLNKFFFWTIVCLLSVQHLSAQSNTARLEDVFKNPPENAKPWVFWYWMYAAVSKEGIKADLEAMKQVGIGGAYLMPIYDSASKLPYEKPVRQLTPEWWQMVNYAMQESNRLGLKLAMHYSDGFALGGGPWITPQLSMQKLVWSKTYIKAGDSAPFKPEQPAAKENFYKDIAIYAYPAKSANAFNDLVLIPRVTTSNGTKAQFLSFPAEDNAQSFRCDSACWIQYAYPQPFTCRSIKIITGGNNYQSQRLIVQASDDGIHFKTITRLQPPRHGWQDADENYTHAIPTTTAKFFRFVYDKDGTEAGSEDLDAAKWKPNLKVQGIYLDDEPVINNIEAKNGSMWRVATNTNTDMVSNDDAVSVKEIINVTDKLDADGNLHWSPPGNGNWVIIRMGHTTTGQTNATGGAAKGLECDKFNVNAIKLQFDNWFAKAFEKTDPGLAKDVLKIFHVDSWECGSQNWSTNFASEFKKRRGYDLLPYLPVMAGVPVESAATSEKILHDVRETIAELVNDIFYSTVKKLAHEKGCSFSAESVAPTMVSDGLMHYKNVDVPMGEFWLNSPTHDKPNDMLDAISGAHIYGKNIIQAEAFTTLRMDWSEHPGNIKTLGDRNFAMGINKMVLHVMAHNPYLDRKPGVTLNGIGLYFQRDQTWFKQSKAWIDYLARVSAVLQQGKPVVDIAVFTGEEMPRRSILPDILVNDLPGIFGKEKVAAEKKRLMNIGQPLRTVPIGVTHSANMADPENWTNALRGYKYDCFNPDALLQSKVVNGKVVMPGGSAYSILVFPGKHPMQPHPERMSISVAKKILELKEAGATILIHNYVKETIGKSNDESELKKITTKLFNKENGKGRVIVMPYLDSSFAKLDVEKDLEILNNIDSVAWAHRSMDNGEIYFISNATSRKRLLRLSFRLSGMQPEIWDAVTGNHHSGLSWHSKEKRTFTELLLPANGSVFIVFRKNTPENEMIFFPIHPTNILTIKNSWRIQFNTAYGGPIHPITMAKLQPWNEHINPAIKYYSGTATYKSTWQMPAANTQRPVWLTIDSIYNIATVKINGIDCGIIWTPPYKLDISKAIKSDSNTIEIEVANTWHNRLIGDNQLPQKQRRTWTLAPFNLQGRPLLKAGLQGEVKIEW